MPVPIIFLAGPEGSGKSSLGERACRDLGLRFLDLSPPEPLAQSPQSSPVPCSDDRARLDAALVDRSSDVIALSGDLQDVPATFKLARRAGVLIGLWSHPLDMQARSGCPEPLFTPSPSLTTHGGFGREGTRCPEFRRLNRACDEVLMLRGLSFEEAATELAETVREIREEAADANASPIEREGLGGWIEAWRDEYGASPKAAQILGDAMARYFIHLKGTGTSPRTLSGIESDLDAAAMLVFGYLSPRASKVLDCFDGVPCEFEYRRKFSDSPGMVGRYRRSLKGFSRFLREGPHREPGEVTHHAEA